MDIQNHFYWNTAKASLVVIATLTGASVDPEYLTDLIPVPAPPDGNDWVWNSENEEWKQELS